MGASTLYGVNTTAMATTPPTMADPNELRGKVRCFFDTVSVNGIEAASTITIAKLPIGAKVVDVRVWHGALGSGVTLSAGISGAATKFIPATSAAAAGQMSMGEHGTDLTGPLYECTAETSVILTTAGATSAGSAIGIVTQVLYVVE